MFINVNAGVTAGIQQLPWNQSSPIRDHTVQPKQRHGVSGKQRGNLGFVSDVPGFSRACFIPAQLRGRGRATLLLLCRRLPHSLAGLLGVTQDVSWEMSG